MRKRITEFELKILSRIWQFSDGATISEILASWDEQPTPGYTTVLKTVQIMRDKGILRHRPDGKAYRYSATQTNTEVSLSEAEEIIARTYAGDRLAFIQGFIDQHALTDDEIDRLARIIEQRRSSNRREK